MRRAPNNAELLGWKPGDRVALFHTDDAGLLDCCNRGAIAAREQGLAHSWSVMMPGRAAAGIAEYARAHPEVDSGLHVTLTSEWPDLPLRPLSNPSPRDGLATPDGRFWPGARDVMRHARPEAIEAEIAAQLDAALAAGLPVTHLDCHMAVFYTRPDFFGAALRVAVSRGIPIMATFGGGAFDALEALTGKLYARLTRTPHFAFPHQPAHARAALHHARLPLIDRIHAGSYGWPPAEKPARFEALLRALRPGITAILVHSALPADDAAPIAPSMPTRTADTHALCDPRLRAVIAECGIHLTTWRDLAARCRGAAASADSTTGAPR